MRNGICKLTHLDGVYDAFEIDEGTPRSHRWPDDVVTRMDPQFPHDAGLADSLFGAGFLILSGKARQEMRAAMISDVEFLPVRILDHRGRMASSDYSLANPLKICDCLDEKASRSRRCQRDPVVITACESLVLKEKKIPGHLHVFRLEHWRKVILIRRSLADRLIHAGVTDLAFVEPQAYRGA